MDTGQGNMAAFYFHKWSTFVVMYVGYTLIVLNRKSFTFAMPAIMNDLHLNKDDLGLIASSQNLAYAMSKFLGGIVSDAVSSKVLFSSGLALAGIFTAAFTGFQTVSAFAVLWFMQGFVQGGSWPACAKVLRRWNTPEQFGTLWSILSSSMNLACTVGPLLATFLCSFLHWHVTMQTFVFGPGVNQSVDLCPKWFPPTVFGMWYAILNTTMNLACCLGPILTLYVIQLYDWRASMTTYGLFSVIVAIVAYMVMIDSPTDVGFDNMTDSKEKGKTRSSRGRGTWQDMLKSPFMWLISTSYLVVYMTRTAALDWAQLFLIQEAGQSEFTGSSFISALETGGFVGAIAAGFLGDKLVAMSRRNDIRGTPRMLVAVGFLVVCTISIHCLIFTIGPHTPQLWITFVGFFLGFGLYGPVSLYGVMAIEAAPTHLSGTSHAIVALSANIGAILAGLPLSIMANYFNWKGSFILLEALLIVMLVVKMATRNLEYKMVPIKKKLQ
ncbi:hypothetical protein LSH36_629g01017 [Paralvinella palmiformis]|uniref:Major facilitator superfamily (MFS) profile domain-containing protein n=1 Tax=Paralvinella palmiformis TaxID=53620 RepID=A0AAD9J4A9_9ANNE|nr:hypothetical protein LSH36_629g01017 [Paralvinella palmiformis]